MEHIRKREWRTPKGALRRAWMVDYQDKLGKRRSKQFPSKEEAAKWLRSAEFESAQDSDNSKKTFGDAVAAWLDRGESEGLERSTMENYRWITDNYLLPSLAKVPLAKLDQSMLVQLRLAIISAKSSELARRVMHTAKMILRYAMNTDVIKKSPAAKIKTAVSARHKRQPNIPSREELRMILSAPAGQNLNRAGKFGHRRDTLDFTLAAESGLRPCERRGLAWAQVDLLEGRIVVLRDVKKDNTIGSCKTKASYRTVPISPKLVAKLVAWKVVCPPSKEDLVFPTQTGGINEHGNLATSFRTRLVSLGITKVKRLPDGTEKHVAKYRLYDLRHAAASWWIYKKIDLKKLTTWLGHSSIQVTFDIYGHLIDDANTDNSLMAELAEDLHSFENSDPDAGAHIVKKGSFDQDTAP